MPAKNKKAVRTIINIPDSYLLDQIESVEIRVRTRQGNIGSSTKKVVTRKDIRDNLSLHQVISHYLGSIAERTCERAVTADLRKGNYSPSVFMTDFFRGDLNHWFKQRHTIYVEMDPSSTGHSARKVFFKIHFRDRKNKWVTKKYTYKNSEQAHAEIAIVDQLWKLKNKKIKQCHTV